MSFRDAFAQPKAVVGMIHVGALPGTPRHVAALRPIVARAAEEAAAYESAGFDGLLIENMHDVPYLCGSVGPEIVAGMTAVGVAVRSASRLPLGVQILAAANREALAVALAVDATFVRVENFAYAHVADEGLMPTAEAGPLLRYRRQIGAESIAIVADVKKKHSSHALTGDISLSEAARTTEFFGAEGIVVTGTATGQPTSPNDVAAVREAVSIPVCIGSGLTPDNLAACWPHTDVFIVGSYVKTNGLWSNRLDHDRLARFMETVHRLRDTA
ncbi:MAG: BtpA/SgcQ family protein [Planctomycetes bacterium]|nr:BtpA/SgcQ family protein [Planctomycetota bacterium]